MEFGLKSETSPQPRPIKAVGGATLERSVGSTHASTQASGSNDTVIIDFSYRITILDIDATGFAGIEIMADGPLRTAEDGSGTDFGVALTHPPSEDVTLTLSVDISGEVAFQPATLTFTQANWNKSQTVQLTGLDDNERDLNKTVRLQLAPSSNDSFYNNLRPVTVYVVNEDDEVDAVVFSDGFESR